MSVHVLGAWHDEAARMVRVGGSWRTVTSITVHVGGQWRQAPSYAPAFSASAPGEVSGYNTTQRPTYITVSASATVTPSGGQPPYTYQWSRQSGDARISAGSPTMATTSFSASLRDQSVSAVFAWTVTDTNGAQASGSTTVDLEADTLQ